MGRTRLDRRLERVKGITVEALQERRRNPKARGWSFIDRIAGVLDVGEWDIQHGDQGKLDEMAGREREEGG